MQNVNRSPSQAKVPPCQPGEIVPGAALVKISSRNVFDAALMRDFPVERFHIQARWDVFNVTNTPEFGQPGNNVTSSSAGSITALSGDPR